MIAGFAISAGTWFAGTFATLDNAYVDLQTRWLQEEIASEIVIVEIDARSLKELGVWPLPRSRHAELLDSLSKAGAARVFLDIDFSAPSTAVEDARLESAIASASSTVVLPAFWQPISQQAAGLMLSEGERARLDKVSAPPLPYPYWHQASTASDRLSPADLALLRPHLSRRS